MSSEYISKVIIQARHVNSDVERRTIKVTADRRSPAYRSEIFAILSTILEADCVEGISQKTEMNVYYVTLKSVANVTYLLNKGEYTDDRDNRYLFSDANKKVVTLKVHWVPRKFSDELLKEVFSEFGKVLSVREEMSPVSTTLKTKNGLRSVVLEATEAQFTHIPHLIHVGGLEDIRMLVTCQGRLPLCLRCRELGHISANCQQEHARKARESMLKANEERGKSYASVAAPPTIDTESLFSQEMEEGTESDSPLVIDESTKDMTPIPTLSSWADESRRDEDTEMEERTPNKKDNIKPDAGKTESENKSDMRETREKNKRKTVNEFTTVKGKKTKAKNS